MRVLREPLVHFLFGGTLLFVLFGVLPGSGGAEPDRVVVSEARIEALAATFERLWLRPPTDSELRALVEDYVREEILYREALALGLDRDDLVVRRRLRQKMEFLHEDLTAPADPTEAQLRDFLERQPDRYRIPARISFEQVFLDPGRPESSTPEARQRAAALLEALRSGHAEALGDATLLPPRLRRATPREVDETFGEGFAARLEPLPPGEWAGPIESAFGLHLIRVESREPGRAPELAEVRGDLERDWRAEQRRLANERFYDELRGRYRVEIRVPEAPSS